LPISEFMGLGAKGKPQQFHTCSNCRTQTTEKKRQLEIVENEQENLEIIKIDDPINLLFNNSGKELAEELIELVEDTDKFSWIYEIILYNLHKNWIRI
ncbi:10418_t:CDS:2, partial [Cetraspora pellucida]